MQIRMIDHPGLHGERLRIINIKINYKLTPYFMIDHRSLDKHIKPVDKSKGLDTIMRRIVSKGYSQ